MKHLFKQVKDYILFMKQCWDLFFDEKKPPAAQPVTEDAPPMEDFKELRSFLKSTMGGLKASVFSSNNSLKSCYAYGDIYDFIRVAEQTHEALMLDKKFNFEAWTEKRSAELIRVVFISNSGEFPDVDKVLTELRWITLRLAEGYELRKRNIDLGLFTLQNLYAAEFLLKDLDSFFMELFHEHRKRNPG